MIRHQNAFWGFGGAGASLAMESLAIAMVEPAFGALLMAAVSLAPLLSAALLPASITAIRVTAIAVRAYEKHCSAMIGPTEPPTQYEIAGIGHRSCRRRSTASSECGKIAAFWCLAAPETGLQKQRTPVAHYNRGSLFPPDARYYQTSKKLSSAFGDDVVQCRLLFRFLRFQVIAHTYLALTEKGKPIKA